MNRQQAIDATLQQLAQTGITLPQQILALGRLYDVGCAHGIIAGTNNTVAAIDLVNAALKPRSLEPRHGT